MRSRGWFIELAAEHADADPLPVKPGDGIVFDEGHPEQDEQGGRVFSVTPCGGRRVELTFEHGHLDFSEIKLGSIVWKTDDPALRRRTEQLYSRDGCPRRRRLDFELTGEIGEPGHADRFGCERPCGLSRIGRARWLARRSNRSRSDSVREQLGRLGDTPFELGDVRNDVCRPTRWCPRAC